MTAADLIEGTSMMVKVGEELIDAECVRIGPGVEVDGEMHPVYILASEHSRKKYDDGRRVLFSRTELWELATRDVEGFRDGMCLMVEMKVRTGQPGKRVQVATPLQEKSEWQTQRKFRTRKSR